MNLLRQNPHVGHRGVFSKLHKAIALLLLLAFSGLQAATQYCAGELGHDPQLGLRLFGVYPPWAVLLWAERWSAPFAEVFAKGLWVGIGSIVATALAITVVWPGRRMTDRLHGSARWANYLDLVTAGLLHRRVEDSVVVGAWRNPLGFLQALRHGGMENVLCFGPPRSGKGAGLVVPTLLSWGHSVFVTDLRGELFQLTSGYRASLGQRVYRFAPGEGDSVAWNPLDEIRLKSEHLVGDVQMVATLLVDPDGKGLQDHWQKTAQSLLVGVILYALLEDDYRATLQRVDALLSDPNLASEQLWETMAASEHSIIAASGRDMLDRPPQEAGSVLSTAKSYLALYRDPAEARNTARCDVGLRASGTESAANTVKLCPHYKGLANVLAE